MVLKSRKTQEVKKRGKWQFNFFQARLVVVFSSCYKRYYQIFNAELGVLHGGIHLSFVHLSFRAVQILLIRLALKSMYINGIPHGVLNE